MSNSQPLGLISAVIISTMPFSATADEALGNTAAPSIYAQAVAGNLLGQTLAWVPQIDGKTRYQFDIPIEGLKQAAKYKDAGSLFYLSAAHDKGLKFTNQNIWSLAATPHSLALDLQRPTANKTDQYTVGFSYSGDQAKSLQVAAALGYKKIIRQEVEITTRLEVGGTASTKAAFGATFLNAEESAQYSGWFEQGLGSNEYYQLGLQSRIFETWHMIDSSVAASQSNAGFSIGTAIYKKFGPVNASLGLEWLERTSDLGIFVGLAFNETTKFGDVLKQSGTTTSTRTAPNWIGDLKPMRRAELMGQWRDGMGFPRNK